MAVTWEVTITPQDIERKTGSVLGVRTDDDPVTGSVVSVKIDTAILDTTAQKIAARQQLWDMYLDYVDRITAIESYVGSMEADAKVWLEAQE